MADELINDLYHVDDPEMQLSRVQQYTSNNAEANQESIEIGLISEQAPVQLKEK